MSQSEIMDFLEANKGRKFSVNELCKALSGQKSGISQNLARLRKTGLVRFESVKVKHNIGSFHTFFYWKD